MLFAGRVALTVGFGGGVVSLTTVWTGDVAPLPALRAVAVQCAVAVSVSVWASSVTVHGHDGACGQLATVTGAAVLLTSVVPSVMSMVMRLPGRPVPVNGTAVWLAAVIGGADRLSG